MSQAADPVLTLFNIHGQAVALRDRADTFTERSEALLLGVERATAQRLLGEPLDLTELEALSEATTAELYESHRLSERARRGLRSLSPEAVSSACPPRPVAPARVVAALPTLSDAAATLRRALPRARLTTLARDLTESLGQLALIATNRTVTQGDLSALRAVFARLDGLPQALSGARERIGVALAELDEG